MGRMNPVAAQTCSSGRTASGQTGGTPNFAGGNTSVKGSERDPSRTRMLISCGSRAPAAIWAR